jgi:flagellar biosynthesis protein FliR
MEADVFVSSWITGFLLVFARIGAAMMFLPGFGETFIPTRVRLGLALSTSLVIHMALDQPLVSAGPVQLGFAFGTEIAVGSWIGLTSRILISALNHAGYTIGMVSGLSNAFAPDAAAFQGATILSSALMIGGIAMVFATDFHLVIVDSLLHSYDVLPPGGVEPGDLAEQMSKAVGASMLAGASLAAPFLVMGILLNAAMGLANRMMPSLPVFFVGTPILIGFAILIMVFAAPGMLRGVIAILSGFHAGFTF